MWAPGWTSLRPQFKVTWQNASCLTQVASVAGEKHNSSKWWFFFSVSVSWTEKAQLSHSTCRHRGKGGDIWAQNSRACPVSLLCKRCLGGNKEPLSLFLPLSYAVCLSLTQSTSRTPSVPVVLYSLFFSLIRAHLFYFFWPNITYKLTNVLHKTWKGIAIYQWIVQSLNLQRDKYERGLVCGDNPAWSLGPGYSLFACSVRAGCDLMDFTGTAPPLWVLA